ncbi:diguanylate cyclase domain-containing protein [Acinetobacter sp. ULE_I037]|uniref:sensor domain-containing diguanylate cyclase n=1 Tax=unclassified Acinetobacter TaxID=196816 RepID=UPI003AF4BAF4
MEQESKKLRDSLEDIKVFEYLQDIDKLHLVSFISQIPLPIALFDQEARFLGVNQKFADIYESDALYLFDKLLNTFSTVVYTHFHEAMRYFAKKNNYFEQEFYVKGKFYLSYFKAIRNQYDEIERVVVVCSDITRLKRRENVLLQNNKKLHDHLYLDFVTGLQNAFAFEHYLNRVWQKSHETYLSFLKIDLDNFKRFNQLNSYTAGDEVLIQLGSVLNEAIAQTEEAEIFRLNSASFIIVIEHLTEWAVVKRWIRKFEQHL